MHFFLVGLYLWIFGSASKDPLNNISLHLAPRQSEIEDYRVTIMRHTVTLAAVMGYAIMAAGQTEFSTASSWVSSWASSTASSYGTVFSTVVSSAYSSAGSAGSSSSGSSGGSGGADGSAQQMVSGDGTCGYYAGYNTTCAGSAWGTCCSGDGIWWVRERPLPCRWKLTQS